MHDEITVSSSTNFQINIYIKKGRSLFFKMQVIYCLPCIDFFRGWRKAINGEKKNYFLVWLNCLIKSFNAYFFAYERCQLYEQKSNTFVGPPHIYIRIPPKDEIRNLLTRNKEFSNIKKMIYYTCFFNLALQ